jgi:hypothetical protein
LFREKYSFFHFISLSSFDGGGGSTGPRQKRRGCTFLAIDRLLAARAGPAGFAGGLAEPARKQQQSFGF